MNRKEYYDNLKHILFPKIKDFSDPQNHVRYSNDVMHMSLIDFFFLYPTGYKLVTWSALLIPLICLMWVWEKYYLSHARYLEPYSLALLIVIFLIGKEIVRKWLRVDLERNMTAYDVMFREYPDFPSTKTRKKKDVQTP